MQESQVITLLFSSWGAITVVLIGLLIYRATLSSKEDDEIFIDSTDQHHSPDEIILHQEQKEIITKMARLKGPIIALSVLSGVLLLTSVGYWAYQGWKNP